MKIIMPKGTELVQTFNELVKPILDLRYGGDVYLNVREMEQRTRKDGRIEYNRVRLGVVSSSAPGAGMSASGRKSAYPCWHAFGHFFDALGAAEPETMIRAGLHMKVEWILAKFHGWVDYKIGGYYSKFIYASEA